MQYEKHLETVKRINDRFRYLKSVESLFELDMWSGLPEEGGAYRQQMAAFIGNEKAGLFRTPEAEAAYAYFRGAAAECGAVGNGAAAENGAAGNGAAAAGSVSPAESPEMREIIERGLIRVFCFRYETIARVPEELASRYNLVKSDVMRAWREAREAKDYRIFAPWLKQAFDLKKEMALAIRPDAPAFDTLIGMTDEGLRSEEVTREFEVLKKGIGAILSRIQASAVRPRKEVLELMARGEDPDAMAAFSRRLAEEAGYDQRRGHIRHNVVHGFTSFMGPRDARVSTQRSGSPHLMFTCLHEAGHAMYATGGNEAVNRANMWGGIEGGFHEGNSRFFENIVGKSREYWEHYFPQLQEAFPAYREVSPEDFYLALHEVKPSLRRIEADEVTYSLHAILRYELERDYFSGRLSAEDMAEAWNDKCESYFGLRPENDLQGVLQDMHWAGDYIGYFQSYALGNIYDGQFREAMLKDIPEVFSDLRRGDFSRIDSWMRDHIWQYGCCFTSGELMQRLCGTRLDASGFVRYLEEKYGKIYNF